MAATNIGNPLGAVPVFDGASPRIVGGYARNAIISGGVFVFASGATGVVTSGASSVTTSDILFAADASGAQFNGIVMQTTEVSGAVAVATRGAFLLTCNGSVIPGGKVECDGNNAVRDCLLYNLGSPTPAATGAFNSIGRAITAGASGGFALIDIQG